MYSAAGSGHLRLAEAIGAADPDAEILLVEAGALERDGGPANPLNRLWDTMIRRGWFRAADLLINRALRTYLFPLAVVTMTQTVIANTIRYAPDAIVTTADGYSLALGEAAAALGVPFTVAQSEHTVFADMLHPVAHYLCPSREVAQAIGRFDLAAPAFADPTAGSARFLLNWWREYGTRRVEGALVHSAGGRGPVRNRLPVTVIGPLLQPDYHAPPGTGGPEPLQQPRLLVVSGSLGGRFVADTVRALVSGGRPGWTVIAVCGTDARLRDELGSLAVQRSGTAPTLQVHGYVHDMPRLMREVDLLIARPSASVFNGAVLAGLPMLLPARATLNDLGAVELATRWGVGQSFQRITDLPDLVDGMLPRLPEYRRCAERIRARYPADLATLQGQVRQVVWRRTRSAPVADPLN